MSTSLFYGENHAHTVNLTELIETHNVFVWERKTNKLRAMGIALLYWGLSCRRVTEFLWFFGVDSDKAFYEAVREWYHRARALLVNHRNGIDRGRERREEGEGKGDVVLPLGSGRHGEENKELLGVALTPTKDGRDASRFIRRVLKTRTNTPTVLVDGGP